ncbi:MAG: hypothetical protein N2712_02450 [Brevinematales bacterium]|nr:hypothetical protein [Brevinematales bacterium]
MKKVILIVVISISGIALFLAVSYLSYLIEINSVQDVVSRFIKAIQTKDLTLLEEISGGSIFVNIFSGDESLRNYYLEEMRKKFPQNIELIFLRVYRASEFSPEERRKYGSISWKVNTVVISKENQYVSGYIFYVSKYQEEDQNAKTIFKVIGISNVGEVNF